ncbi:MAG: EAL domain-containing protein, partial [Selenomonadaceae bacterium]
ISPAVFIPAFERNGFIMELDIYIWEIVCRLLRKWIDAGYDPQPISVNVSRLDLYRTDLCDVLNNMVKKYNLDPGLLQLELTESAYTENPQQIIEVTKQLQKMGFPILMDDFGSGYSSLNMLKDISVDVLKIDLHFLDSQDESGRGGNILNSVVRMAEWLKIPVIAEGVETKQQADFMRDIGCYCVQGYYYSKPIGVEEYEALMNSI